MHTNSDKVKPAFGITTEKDLTPQPRSKNTYLIFKPFEVAKIYERYANGYLSTHENGCNIWVETLLNLIFVLKGKACSLKSSVNQNEKILVPLHWCNLENTATTF